MRQEFFGVVGEIDTLPGCSQIAVSHAVFLPKEHRGKGVGRAAHQARLNELKRLGYDYVLCTVDVSNVAQVKLMDEFHWQELSVFVSTKTEHQVRLYGKRL